MKRSRIILTTTVLSLLLAGLTGSSAAGAAVDEDNSAAEVQDALPLADGYAVVSDGVTYEGSVPMSVLTKEGIPVESVPVEDVQSASVTFLPSTGTGGLELGRALAPGERCKNASFVDESKNLLGRTLTRMTTAVYWCYKSYKITVDPTVSRTGYAAYGWVFDQIDSAYGGYCSSSKNFYQVGGQAHFYLVDARLVRRTERAYGLLDGSGGATQNAVC